MSVFAINTWYSIQTYWGYGSWADYTSPYGPALFKRDQAGYVHLSGLVQISSTPTVGDPITFFDTPGFRLAKNTTRIFHAIGQDTVYKTVVIYIIGPSDTSTANQVVYNGGALSGASWISLAGIRWLAES